MAFEWASLSIEDRNQVMLDLAQGEPDRYIAVRSREGRSPWRTMIPRGPYTLGQGLVKTAHQFYPGLGDLRGLQKWRPIVVSKAAAAGQPTVDACDYNPYTLQHGFRSVDYSGFQTERKTKALCVRDIRFTWEFEQQVTLIMSFLADISISVWANYSREMYIKMAVDSNNAFVLAGGMPNQYAFEYDPFSADADGDNVLTLSREAFNRLSLMDPKALMYFRRKLEFMAMTGALGDDSGQPVYGLVGDLDDVDDMIARNPDWRERYLYADPSLLIQGYGKVRKIPGYGLMDDMQAPRFAVKHLGASDVTLRRVDAFTETEEGATDGVIFVVNEDYLKSEITMGIVFVRNVYMIETPPVGPAAPGGGTSFGTTPGLMGQFEWINNKDNDQNLLGEKGFMFARFEAFAKPLAHADQPVCFLYKRCPGFKIVSCGTNEDVAAAESTLVHVLNATAYQIDDENENLATVTLTDALAGEVGAEVTVVNDSDVEVSAIIADSSQSPTYILAFADGARPAEADMNDTAHAGVKMA